jgi:hypothetical protein
MKKSPLVLTLLLAATSAAFAQSAPPVTGQGAGVYQVVRNWPTYPEGQALGDLHGDIAADSQGNVYIATGGAIHVIGKNGAFIKDLGDATRGVHGMKVRKQGDEEFLFIAQNGLKAVSKLKLDGTLVWRIAGHPKVEGMYPNPGAYQPTDVDVAPDGTIYIADGYGMSLMHIYDKDQNYVKTFGGKGTVEDGQFNVCHNVLVDTRSSTPSLLISDRQNNRLMQYDMQGKYLATIATDLRQPCAADIHGDRLAVGELGGRVTIFDKHNKAISRLGDEPADRPHGNNNVPPDQWIEGAVVSIHGLTFDPKGDLYAMDYTRFGRVTRYTSLTAKD